MLKQIHTVTRSTASFTTYKPNTLEVLLQPRYHVYLRAERCKKMIASRELAILVVVPESIELFHRLFCYNDSCSLLIVDQNMVCFDDKFKLTSGPWVRSYNTVDVG